MKYYFSLLIILILSGSSFAQTIVSWNVKDIFSIEDVDERKSDFQAFDDLLDPDILILQEVTSVGEVEQIAKVMGWTSYHLAVSNFANDNDSRGSFEVAILSKYELQNVYEYETIPDERQVNGVVERKIEDPEIDGFAFKRSARGFLSAYVEELSLWVTAIHLKSSLGRSGISHDGDNAQKREAIILGYKDFVDDVEDLHTNASFLIAGDFNVGHCDDAKNGESITNDQTDGYDDTHAILLQPIGRCECTFTNLMSTVKTTTYPGFDGSPIDNIYVMGSINFSLAQKATETFGSDHLPVFCEIQ